MSARRRCFSALRASRLLSRCAALSSLEGFFFWPWLRAFLLLASFSAISLYSVLEHQKPAVTRLEPPSLRAAVQAEQGAHQSRGVAGWRASRAVATLTRDAGQHGVHLGEGVLGRGAGQAEQRAGQLALALDRVLGQASHVVVPGAHPLAHLVADVVEDVRAEHAVHPFALADHSRLVRRLQVAAQGPAQSPDFLDAVLSPTPL